MTAEEDQDYVEYVSASLESGGPQMAVVWDLRTGTTATGGDGGVGAVNGSATWW